MYATKKAAREAGCRSESNLSRGAFIARHHAEPTVIKGERFYGPDQYERLISRTAARKMGLRVPDEDESVRWLCHQVGDRAKAVTYAAYRESDCKPFARRVTHPAKTVDLIAAIFAVNKSAKRYRDAAQAQYACENHGLARAARKKKEMLYRLKDRGVASATRRGRLQFVGMNGELALYRGEGLCVHSTLVPKAAVGAPQHDDDLIFREAVPRSASEARLKDAIHTLERLPKDKMDGFARLETPCRSRSRNNEYVTHAVHGYDEHPEEDEWDSDEDY